MKLYHQYIHPVAETFAWCLMKNHFHALVYVCEENNILTDLLEYTNVGSPKILDASRQFGHLFNAYTQAVNKRYGRTGRLFKKPFVRKRVDSGTYLKNLIFYIHYNPIHHGFTTKANDYPWSSYGSVLSEKLTKLNRDEVFGIYGTKGDFVKYHEMSGIQGVF